MNGGFPGQADPVQHLVEGPGHGNAGDRNQCAAVVVVSQTDLTADVIAVKVHLKAGHGHDLQIRSLTEHLGPGTAGLHTDAAQFTGWVLSQVLAVAAAAIVGHCLALADNFHFTQRHTVGVKLGTAGAAGNLAGHGNADHVPLRGLLDGIALGPEAGMAVNGGIVQVPCNAPKELGQFFLMENHRAGRLFLGHRCMVTGSHLLHLLGDLGHQFFLPEGAEVILLVELHTLGFPVIGGDGLHHGTVADLGFLKSPAVAQGFGMAAQEDFQRVDGGVFHRIGPEHQLCDLRSQFCRLIIGEIALHFVASGLGVGKFKGAVFDEQGLGHRFIQKIPKLGLGGGGIDKELGLALEFPMGHIDRHLFVAGVGTTNGFQGALHEKQLVAFLLADADPVVADAGIGIQQFFDLIHPNFTFTFSAGPPSLTRTHSL